MLAGRSIFGFRIHPRDRRGRGGSVGIDTVRHAQTSIGDHSLPLGTQIFMAKGGARSPKIKEEVVLVPGDDPGSPSQGLPGSAFEILEHPADIGFRAFGGTLASVFESAALAL